MAGIVSKHWYFYRTAALSKIGELKIYRHTRLSAGSFVLPSDCASEAQVIYPLSQLSRIFSESRRVAIIAGSQKKARITATRARGIFAVAVIERTTLTLRGEIMRVIPWAHEERKKSQTKSQAFTLLRAQEALMCLAGIAGNDRESDRELKVQSELQNATEA